MSEEIWQSQYSGDGSSLHQSLYLEKDFLLKLSSKLAKESFLSVSEEQEINREKADFNPDFTVDRFVRECLFYFGGGEKQKVVSWEKLGESFK